MRPAGAFVDFLDFFPPLGMTCFFTTERRLGQEQPPVYFNTRAAGRGSGAAEGLRARRPPETERGPRASCRNGYRNLR